MSAELEARKALWLGHGHIGLYGDDGEMQCAACTPWDYKNAPLADVARAALAAVSATKLCEGRDDDMTLEQAQAEAERRWPSCVFTFHERSSETTKLFELSLPGEPWHYYAAVTAVGCLDQAIAAEARRGPR